MSGRLGPRAVKNGVRHVLHGLLNGVPLRVLLPLRSAYAAAPPGSARERALGAALELVRLRGIPSETFSLPDNPDVLFGRADCLLLERAYWMGQKSYERPLLASWRSLCRRSAKVVEIGANVGYYTVQGALASPSSRFIVVEPHPFSAAALRRNLEVNGIANVQVVEAAATDGRGPSKLELAMPLVDHFRSPAGAFVAGKSEISHMYDGVTTMEVDAVDVRDIVTDVDLIKIDAEGMEAEILGALSGVIHDRRPTIVVELLDGTPRLRALIADLCRSPGYCVYVPTCDGLVPIDPATITTISVLERFRCRDVILRVDG